MYKKVVVPLDGSKLAELALPHLEEIARGCSIPDILLVSVTEKITGKISQGQTFEPFVPERPVPNALPATGTPQFNVVYNVYAAGRVQDVPMTMGRMAKTAADYLCKVADSLGEKGFNVSATVLVGNPAEQITRYLTEKEADLIVMASTGKSKISRWNMSTIAAKVIKDTCVPVLLVKPPDDFKETKPKRRGMAL